MASTQYRTVYPNRAHDVAPGSSTRILRKAALGFGIVFLLTGIAGFIPSLVVPPPGDTPAGGTWHYGLLLGIFPTNTPHNIVHLLFGFAGIAAWFAGWARPYLISVAVIYAVLAVLGALPGLGTLQGHLPLFGADVILHALLAIVAAAVVWISKRRALASAGP